MAIFRSNIRRFRRKMLNKRFYPLLALSLAVFTFLLSYLTFYTWGSVNVTARLDFITTVEDPAINWTKFAYVQYVTSPTDLCKAVMLFSELKEVSSPALRVLYYPNHWKLDPKKNNTNQVPHTPGQLLRYAAEEFLVILRPTAALREHSSDRGNKFLAYNLTEYERVIVLGLDTIVLNAMDELFFLPPAPLALPYVYWPNNGGRGGNWRSSDQLMVIQPSSSEFSYVKSALAHTTDRKTDLEIIDTWYGDSVIRLPQRPYHLLTQEFQLKYWQHDLYLGTSGGEWDTEKILRETRLVHFSEPTMPKPWTASNTTIISQTPRCVPTVTRRPDCSTSIAWYGFYVNYINRRMNICGKGFETKYKEEL